MKSKRWLPDSQQLVLPNSLMRDQNGVISFPDVLAERVGDLARRMAMEHEAGTAKQFESCWKEITDLRADNTSLRLQLDNSQVERCQDDKTAGDELQKRASMVATRHISLQHRRNSGQVQSDLLPVVHRLSSEKSSVTRRYSSEVSRQHLGAKGKERLAEFIAECRRPDEEESPTGFPTTQRGSTDSGNNSLTSDHLGNSRAESRSSTQVTASSNVLVGFGAPSSQGHQDQSRMLEIDHIQLEDTSHNELKPSGTQDSRDVVKRATFKTNSDLAPEYVHSPSAALSRSASLRFPSMLDHQDRHGDFIVLAVWENLRDLHKKRSRLHSDTTRFTGELSIDDIEEEDPSESMSAPRVGQWGWWQTMVLDPCCNRRIAWEVLAVLCLLADTVYVPLQILELDEHQFNGPVSWVIRLYWTLNMPVTVFTGYFQKDGSLQTNLKATAARYARRWLVPDILLVAFDWLEVPFALLISRHWILRVSRLVRFVRITRISSNVRSAMTFRHTSERVAILFNIVGIMICLVALTHVIACLWYSFGKNSLEKSWTWIAESGMEDAKMEYQYVASFHWALSQFAGGMDEIRPGNLEERIFTVTVLLLGFMVLSVCVSGLTSSMTRLILISSAQSRQLAKLRQYLSETHISRRLAMRIQSNAQYIMSQHARRLHEQDVELLAQISDSMRVELHFEIHAPHLMAHCFFERYDEICPSGMRSICHKAICLKTWSPGDLVFTCGETPATPQMLFVVDGCLRYMKPNFFDKSQVVPTQNLETCSWKSVGRGSWISEANLWTEWEHQGTMSAASFCDVLAVDAATFQEIVSRFQGDFLDECVDYAFNFVKFLNSLVPAALTDLELLNDRRFQRARPVDQSTSFGSRETFRSTLADLRSSLMSRLSATSTRVSSRRSTRSTTRSTVNSAQRSGAQSENALVNRSRTMSATVSAKKQLGEAQETNSFDKHGSLASMSSAAEYTVSFAEDFHMPFTS